MVLVLGLISFSFWSLLGLFIQRKLSPIGFIFTPSNKVLLPIFTLFVPVMALLSEILIFFLIGPHKILNNEVYIIQTITIIFIPVAIIVGHFIAVFRLQAFKKNKEYMDAQARQQLKDWLADLQEYQNDLEFNFFTYVIDGKLAGQIFVSYGLESSADALIRSKDNLPTNIKLHIKSKNNTKSPI